MAAAILLVESVGMSAAQADGPPMPPLPGPIQTVSMQSVQSQAPPTPAPLPQPMAEQVEPLPPRPLSDPTAGVVPAPAGMQQFTLDDLQSMAMRGNPSVAVASARVQAMRGEWVQVGLYPNPTAGYSGVEIGDEGRAGQQGAFVSQDFIMGGKLQLNRATASQQVRRAEQELAAARMRVINDVQLGYFEVLVAQRRIEVTEQLAGIGQRGLDTTNKLFKAQDVPRLDILQAQVEANNARILADNAQAQHIGAWRRLTTVLGMPELTMAYLVGDPADRVPDISWENALCRLLSSSPELAAARAEVGRARYALMRARKEPVPDLNLQLSAQHDNATGSDIAGVQAGMPLPLFNRNQGGILRAEGELNAASQEVARLQLDLQRRLTSAFERYQMARQQVDRYRSSILPDARRSLEMVDLGYGRGEFSYLLVLTTQRTYFQTTLAYLESLAQVQASAIEIEGMLLSGSLGRMPRTGE